MKKIVKRILQNLGYVIAPANSNLLYVDPIMVQQKLIGKDKKITIFDVGAHSGETTLLYNHFFKNATIYSFEPFPDTFNMMKQKVAGYPNIKIFNLALASKGGKANFHVNKYNYTNSLLATHEDAIKTWGIDHQDTKEIIEVNSDTLDRFVEKMQIENIDILKIDTQGSEYSVIEGAAQTIDAQKVRLIYLEIITMPAYKEQKFFDEVLHLLRLKGFHLHNFFNFSFTNAGELRQLDAIFLSEKYYAELHAGENKTY
jgi:FkbM family methyltransferase